MSFIYSFLNFALDFLSLDLFSWLAGLGLFLFLLFAIFDLLDIGGRNT